MLTWDRASRLTPVMSTACDCLKPALRERTRAAAVARRRRTLLTGNLVAVRRQSVINPDAVLPAEELVVVVKARLKRHSVEGHASVDGSLREAVAPKGTARCRERADVLR